MPPAPRKRLSAVAAHRERQRARGLQRVEVQVASEDAPLLRSVAAALADPARAPATRALLRARMLAPAGRDLKALLEAAPLEDDDIERSRDTGRDVAL
jgi:hypothetical protein